MDPLEPDTTGELASLLDVPKRLVRRLVEALSTDDEIRKKAPEPDRTIWIREPRGTRARTAGGRSRFGTSTHIFSAAQYCPRCGTRLS